MRFIIAALLLTIALPLTSSCGQMGPLYMPAQEAPQEAPQGKPAAQKDNSQEQPGTP